MGLRDALAELEHAHLLVVLLGQRVGDRALRLVEQMPAVAVQEIERFLFHACFLVPFIRRVLSWSKVCGSAVFSAMGWRRNSIRAG